MAELVSALVWAPMGAEHDADLLHDGLGSRRPRRRGCCATARGRWPGSARCCLTGGAVPDGAVGDAQRRRAAMAAAWLGPADFRTVRAAFAASPAESVFPGGWYRNQLGFALASRAMCCCAWESTDKCCTSAAAPARSCVKFSTWPDALNPAYLQDTLRALDAIGGVLAGRERTGGGRRRLAGGRVRPEPPRRFC